MWSPKMCKYVFSLSEVLLSPLVRLQSCSLGQKRRREPVKQVLCPRYQQFVREILGNSRQEVVDHGHVTLALLHLLLSVQHDLRSKRRENRFNTRSCDLYTGFYDSLPWRQGRWASAGATRGKSRKVSGCAWSLRARGQTMWWATTVQRWSPPQLWQERYTCSASNKKHRFLPGKCENCV